MYILEVIYVPFCMNTPEALSVLWIVTAVFLLQAFWAANDTGVVFVGWRHEPFRLGLKHCPNRR